MQIKLLAALATAAGFAAAPAFADPAISPGGVDSMQTVTEHGNTSPVYVVTPQGNMIMTTAPASEDASLPSGN
jgi:hypothetical protein